ncbi:MAG: hypothetical protein H6Q99_325 [Proteobacteria bacterium]|nr:hypothetical protein [Pseudomonadota bacterium]
MGSFAYETALSPWNGDSLAGGRASLGEIFTAADDEMRLGANSNSRWAALEDAYDDRNDAIFKATGQRLPNPVRDPVLVPFGNGAGRAPLPAAVAYPQGSRAWKDRLAALAKQYPDAAEAIGAERPIDDDAGALLQAAEGRSAEASASRPGVGGFLAGLAGGIRGSFRDPLQVMAMVVSGGESTAVTIGGRLLGTAGREALVNGLSEAVIQPEVQAWRKEAGVDHGLGRAFGDVMMAAGLGAGFGTIAQGLREVVPALRGIGQERAVPSELRGAVDAIDADEAVAAMKLPDVSPATHDEAMAAGVRAAETGEVPPYLTETPMESANRELWAAAPDDMGRLDALSRQRDINAAALTDLQARSMDDATFAPVRRAFIEAEAAAADADRLRAAADASKIETERTLLGERAAARDREAERILGTIDPEKARELRDIEGQLKLRREGQTNVEQLLGEARAKVDELRAPLLDKYRRAPEPAPEIMLPAEYGPTIKASPDAWADAVAKAEADGKGQIIGALYNDELGHVAAPWSMPGDKEHGLAGLIGRGRRDVVERLPEIIRNGRVEMGRSRARIFTDDHGAVVRLDFRRQRGKGQASGGSPWLLTAFRKEDNAGDPKFARSEPEGVTVNSSPPPAPENIGATLPKNNSAAIPRRSLSGSAGDRAAIKEAQDLRDQAREYLIDSSWSSDPKASKIAYQKARDLEARADEIERRVVPKGKQARTDPATPGTTAPTEATAPAAELMPAAPARAENEAINTLRRALSGTADERAAAHRKLGQMVDTLQRREGYEPKIHGQATVDLLTHALGGDPDRVVSSLARDAAGADVDVTFQRGLEVAGRGDALSEMIDACKAR